MNTAVLPGAAGTFEPAPPPQAPSIESQTPPAPTPDAAAAPGARPGIRPLSPEDRKRARNRQIALTLIAPLAGACLLLALWTLASDKSAQFPSPLATWKSAQQVFAHPFYDNGPNDVGIGWNLLASLKRVAYGFGLAAALGIPLGFAIGRMRFLNRMLGPIISLLRPVSPLAWLPIGLYVFSSAPAAAIWTIFICSIWPMMINTAIGVQRVPQDYLNVARVLNLSTWKVFTKILLPSVMPYMMTGVRLSVSTAWLVIVAAEMLTGGTGIGFWLWNEWNNLNMAHIVIAILVIGVTGMLLEALLMLLARRFSYDQAH
ncbi:bicarbonate transport system permease protein CmpB [mine drainage metagenome]|uniref:Bicarbonate transport system permease protein CmpB n=1 Tax=mine drainage metagenome TaxID=410659 RepID=A0A1J5RE37_9ZZZZ